MSESELQIKHLEMNACFLVTKDMWIPSKYAEDGEDSKNDDDLALIWLCVHPRFCWQSQFGAKT